MPMNALRSFRHSPGPSLLAILALALGLGAGTAIFTLLDRLLLHPVPYPEPARLAAVWINQPSFHHGQFSGHDFTQLEAAAGPFSAVGAVGLADGVLQGPEGPMVLRGARVSGQLLPLLGVRPALGRLSFTPEEDRLGGPGAAILSYRLWQRQFSGDPAVLGRGLVVSGRSRTVVGVLPPDFTSPTARMGKPDLILPIAFQPDELVPEAGADYEVIARLQPGISLTVVNQQLQALRSLLSANRTFEAGPLAEDLAEPYRARLGLLAGAVALLLVAVSANASGLLLARFSERRGVLALQGVLGAAPGRLAAQVLSEGAAFGGAGALLGLLLEAPLRSFLATQLGLAHPPARLAWSLPLALGLGLVTGLAAAFLPALHAARTQPQAALQDYGTRATVRARSRKVLIALEVALSFMLLATSGTLLRALWTQMRRGPGFNPRDLYVCNVPLPQDRQGLAVPWARSLVQRLRETPGVEGVFAGLPLPIYNPGGWGHARAETGPETRAWHHFVEGDAAATLGLPLLEGRSPQPGERDSVLISRPLARALWPNGTAVGHHLQWDDQTWTVTGVVEGTREDSLDEPLRPQVFLPIPKETGSLPSLDLVVRSRAGQAAVRSQVRAALAGLDPQAGAMDPVPFSRAVAGTTEAQRQAAYPLALLGGISAFLSALGLYGLLSQLFRSRRKELGIRAALGAPPRSLSALVAGTGLRLLLWGLCGGILGTLALGRILGHQMAGAGSLDPPTLAAAGLFLALGAGLACVGPALTAAFTPPGETLRES
jgi:putative ABC transport system permease protein